MSDKCPFCGAEHDGALTYSYICSTFGMINPDKTEILWNRSTKCSERQIAQLQERLEAWREFWRENIRYVDKHHHDINGHLDRLKELGEITLSIP